MLVVWLVGRPRGIAPTGLVCGLPSLFRRPVRCAGALPCMFRSIVEAWRGRPQALWSLETVTMLGPSPPLVPREPEQLCGSRAHICKDGRGGIAPHHIAENVFDV